MTTEAKYVVVLDAAKVGFWFKKFIMELEVMTSDAIPLYCDNNGAIALARSQDLIKNLSTSSSDITSYMTISKKNIEVRRVDSMDNMVACTDYKCI